MAATLVCCASAAGAHNHKNAARDAEPAWWLRQAACIAWYESRNGAASPNIYQFEWGTYASVGGVGDPSLASRSEQTYRAWLVYQRDGGSWREWSTASLCGLN